MSYHLVVRKQDLPVVPLCFFLFVAVCHFLSVNSLCSCAGRGTQELGESRLSCSCGRLGLFPAPPLRHTGEGGGHSAARLKRLGLQLRGTKKSGGFDSCKAKYRWMGAYTLG